MPVQRPPRTADADEMLDYLDEVHRVLNLGSITVEPVVNGDSAPYIQAAINKMGDSGGGIVKLIDEPYTIESGLTISNNRVHLLGCGKHVTQLIYNPSSAGSAIKFWIDDNTDIFQCSLRGIGIISSDTTYQKVGLQIRKASEMVVEDFAVGGGGGSFTGASSIGLQIQGHEISTVRNVSLNTDQPISIEDNPNSDYDLDFWRFEQCYLISKSDDTLPCLEIATGINVNNTVFDGLIMAHGSNGVEWIDTTSTLRSSNIAFKNVRWEQSANTAAWFFDVESFFGMDFLRIENAASGAGGAFNKGFKFRKIRHLTLENTEYSNTLTGLDTDSTVVNLSLQNARFPNTTLTLPASVFFPQLTAVIATADLAAASDSLNGTVLIEDAGAGDRNLILYAGGQRFRIDGGANF
jgi:hypothetical protein